MKKAEKVWIIIGSLLVFVGIVVFVGTLFFADFDLGKLSSKQYTDETYMISESFDKISIDVTVSDINFVLSDTDECKVVCREEENLRHSVSVNDGVLVIKTVDTQKWYDHIGIVLGSVKVTVYLPEAEYSSLSVKTDTGDVVCNVAVSESVKISTDTGDVKISDISCETIIAESDTGDISIKNSLAAEELNIETDTGDVLIEKSDAAKIFIETDTGDVKGTLLTEKIFTTKTSTGDVSVPKSSRGGSCEIKTDTGDIEIRISN